MTTEHSLIFINSLTIFRSYRSQFKCNCISIRELLKLISQILIPLMMGIFTLVIALQQHRLNKQNRMKDQDIANQLRTQQYQLDEQQRAQELALNDARRTQDLAIADNKQRDAVLNMYIRDLSNLLLVNNYILNRPMLNSIIRPMTLTVLRQLDPLRKVLLIKFLYESKMLRTDYENIRVDLTDADLNRIRIGRIQMRNISLSRTSMINASFISTDLNRADFQGADLTNALFMNTDLSEVNFYRTRLVRVQFNGSILIHSDMASADLTQSLITEEQMSVISSCNMARMPNGSEALNASLINKEDQCLLLRWTINPRRSIKLTNECLFVALKDNITMKYDLPVYSYRRLFERQEALLQFRFQAKIQDENNLRIDFIYHDAFSIAIRHRGKPIDSDHFFI